MCFNFTDCDVIFPDLDFKLPTLWKNIHHHLAKLPLLQPLLHRKPALIAIAQCARRGLASTNSTDILYVSLVVLLYVTRIIDVMSAMIGQLTKWTLT